MDIAIYNEDKDSTKFISDLEYEDIRKGKAIFSGAGKLYRLDFPDQDELKSFIEDLIELYNSREED